MTLRKRLTSAFLAVVVGPVLLGTVFVAVTVTAVASARAEERLRHADTSVRTVVAATCQRLIAAGQAAAALSGGGTRPEAAGQVIAQGLAEGVRLDRPAGAPVYRTGAQPAAPWADCTAGPEPGIRYTALSARVAMRGPDGLLLGYAEVVQPIDGEYWKRLGEAGGVTVTPAGSGTEGHDRIRHVPATPGQPLAMDLSTPGPGLDGLYAILIGMVLAAAVVAVAAATWLARSTTRPLAELADAVDRLAAGHLDTRVPVLGRDEVGRLGTDFNRMARETQAYVRDLTASRDQLRASLARLGDTLSGTHDLNRILEVILHTALATTSATAGLVLLVERDDPGRTGWLRGWQGYGLENRGHDGGPVDLDALWIRTGEGLIGQVAATGQACFGRADLGVTLSPAEPRCRSFVAVPFTGASLPSDQDGGLLGVLILYDRVPLDRDGGGDFAETDLVELRQFAGQAAVAVENVLLHAEARRLSVTDPLTGLWNYRHLRDSLRLEVERAGRFGRKLGVLALDLDRFKQVNDGYGHAVGDAVLVEFARRIKSAVREVDLLFRHGGEEFVALLPETDAAGGVTVAQRIGAAIRATPFPVGDPHARPIRITVSIGIAIYPDHGTTGTEVLRAADAALYEAKAAGRDTFASSGRQVEKVPGPGPADSPRGASGGTTAPRQTRGG